MYISINLDLLSILKWKIQFLSRATWDREKVYRNIFKGIFELRNFDNLLFLHILHYFVNKKGKNYFITFSLRIRRFFQLWKQINKNTYVLISMRIMNYINIRLL